MSGKKKVILISGKLKSGKSTVSELLKKELETSKHFIESYRQIMVEAPPEFKTFSYASKLKQIARESFGWDDKKDEKGRILLQRLGTEVGRAYNKNIWVDYFSEEIQSQDENVVYFVDDWRFMNEKDAIDFGNFDGDIYTVRVHRDIKTNNKNIFQKIWTFFKSTVHEKHASEISLPENKDFYNSYLINNYNSVQELEKSVEFRQLCNNIFYFIIN